MSSKGLLGFLALAAVLTCASCSGLKSKCTTNCGPTGNATVSMTMFDTPPTGVNLLSFTLPIAGISLTPSTGSPVAITTTTSSFEATRLQTDSALIADAVSVPAGSYTTLSVTLGPTSATSNVFINASGSTITWTTGSGGSCANGAVCTLPGGAVFTVAIPMTLTLASNQNQWIGLHLNLNNAITTSGGLSVDFSQTNVLTATTTTRTGLPSGAVDTIEDFVGVVTAYTGGSRIVVKSGISGQSLTATLNSSTEYDTPNPTYSNCAASPTCIKVGSTVSLNANLASSGTLTATEVDVLDATAVNEVEGILYPTSNVGVYGLIVADTVVTDGNAALASATFGSGVFLTLSQSATFSIDTGILSPVLPSPVGFAGTGDIRTGQVVRAHLSTATTASNGINATASQLLLRNSRITASVNTVGGNAFTLTNTPAYLGTFTIPPQVQTYVTNTLFDGVAGASSLTVGQSVSVRALYLNAAPAFQAAKVRAH